MQDRRAGRRRPIRRGSPGSRSRCASGASAAFRRSSSTAAPEYPAPIRPRSSPRRSAPPPRGRFSPCEHQGDALVALAFAADPARPRCAPISRVLRTCVPPHACRSIPGISISRTRLRRRGGATDIVFTSSGRASSSRVGDPARARVVRGVDERVSTAVSICAFASLSISMSKSRCALSSLNPSAGDRSLYHRAEQVQRRESASDGGGRAQSISATHPRSHRR